MEREGKGDIFLAGRVDWFKSLIRRRRVQKQVLRAPSVPNIKVTKSPAHLIFSAPLLLIRERDRNSIRPGGLPAEQRNREK